MKVLAEEVSSDAMTLSIARVQVGPVVLYRYRATLQTTGRKLAWWMLCPPGLDGASFGWHLPTFLDARLNRWVDEAVRR